MFAKKYLKKKKYLLQKAFARIVNISLCVYQLTLIWFWPGFSDLSVRKYFMLLVGRTYEKHGMRQPKRRVEFFLSKCSFQYATKLDEKHKTKEFEIAYRIFEIVWFDLLNRKQFWLDFFSIGSNLIPFKWKCVVLYRKQRMVWTPTATDQQKI